MAEQEEPTVVEVDGRYHELGFTLPGEKSDQVFNKLKGYVEEAWYDIRRRSTSIVSSKT